MKNSDELEKSRGIVVFAVNTEHTDYVSIAQQTAKLASHTLGLPYKIITEAEIGDITWHNYRNDRDTNQFVEWKNFGRNLAYELSPFDETLVIDADYVVLDHTLAKIFETDWNYLLQRQARSINDEHVSPVMGAQSLPYVWATVFAFRRNHKSKMFFDLVRRIQANYHYYRELFLVESQAYRNDYAFAMADVIVNGFCVSDAGIPGALLNVLQPIDSITVKNNQLVIKDSQKAYVVPKMNLHITSKRYLASEDFKKFINHVTA